MIARTQRERASEGTVDAAGVKIRERVPVLTDEVGLF
jgi:hypothetical protein